MKNKYVDLEVLNHGLKELATKINSVFRKIKDSYTKTEIDDKFTSMAKGMNWKPSVATKVDLEALTDNSKSDTRIVEDESKIYMYNGTSWEGIGSSANVPKATINNDGLMSKEDFTKLEGIELDKYETKEDFNTKLGRLTSLNTDNKDSVVSAINEVKEGVNNTVKIDDTVVDTNKVYSSKKINDTYVKKEENKSLVPDSEIEKIHTHTNKNYLDKISENAEGKPLYNGNIIGDDLKPATKDTLGGIKVGDNLTINAEGVLSAKSGNSIDDTNISTNTTYSSEKIEGKFVGEIEGYTDDELKAMLGLSEDDKDLIKNLITDDSVIDTAKTWNSSVLNKKFNNIHTHSNKDDLDKLGHDEKGNLTYNEVVVGGSSSSITVDTELNSTSENPVQNKVVKEAIDKNGYIIFDSQEEMDNFLNSSIAKPSIFGNLNGVLKKISLVHVDEETKNVDIINEKPTVTGLNGLTASEKPTSWYIKIPQHTSSMKLSVKTEGNGRYVGSVIYIAKEEQNSYTLLKRIDGVLISGSNWTDLTVSIDSQYTKGDCIVISVSDNCTYINAENSTVTTEAYDILAWVDNSITVDAELNSTSENPVQNKVINAKLDEVFQSVSNGKTRLETAITDMGGTVSKAGYVATFNELDNSIKTISQSIPIKYSTLPNWVASCNQDTIFREAPCCVCVDGYVYLLGGKVGNSCVSSLSIYDADNDKWINGTTTGITSGFSYGSSCFVSGYWYIVGGYNGSSTINTVYKAKITSKSTKLSFSKCANIPISLACISVNCVDNKIYAFGGWRGGNYINNVYVYNIITDTWSITECILPNKMAAISNCVYNNKIYLISGMIYTDDNKFRESTAKQMFNPSTKTLTQLSKIDSSIGIGGGFMNSVSFNNCIYVVGGASESIDGSWHPYMREWSYIYNCITDTIKIIKSIPIPRVGSATCYYNNRVYCIGGQSNGDILGLNKEHTTGGDDSLIQIYIVE